MKIIKFMPFKPATFAALFLLISCISNNTPDIAAQTPKVGNELPIRGLAIAAPAPDGLDNFLRFVENELAPAGFNLIILRVDWNYKYKSHPELSATNPLTDADVKKIVSLCKKHKIALAPQINLLGHQSWANRTGMLLSQYPEFDETPHVKTENYTGWPNDDGLYCKSYCPLHPDLHKIVFALIDEITDVFESDYFHAGMDEVFYIGDSHCPRCSGHNKAELFAGEAIRLRNHLAERNKRLMIWGDRLIDGETTGIGEWEASTNDTHPAIDLIPKDIFICDWHYDRPEKTPVYFAMKGFDVAICPWNKPNVAMQELDDMLSFRKSATPQMREHYQGIIATVWSGNENFLKRYYETPSDPDAESDATVLKRLIERMKQ
ncbi:MAG: family 20 glycosylhydrolase [Tannerellaceae bacterium]|jgi:hypothetical protein|nr:family 20 glycosylhydrolase [Tannerellaceae bacterium]